MKTMKNAVGAGLLALGTGAAAEDGCFETPGQAGSWLAEEHGEDLVAVLPSALSGGWIMIYVAADASWTAVHSDADGITCVVDAGPGPALWEMPVVGEAS